MGAQPSPMGVAGGECTPFEGLGWPKGGGGKLGGGQLPIWCLPLGCTKLHPVVLVAKWPQSAPQTPPKAQPKPWGVVGLPTHA